MPVVNVKNLSSYWLKLIESESLSDVFPGLTEVLTGGTLNLKMKSCWHLVIAKLKPGESKKCIKEAQFLIDLIAAGSIGEGL